MGLDITAHRRIKKLDCVFNASGEPIDKTTFESLEYDFKAYLNDDFPERADDVENEAIYASEDQFGFRAGSYSGYNAWREALAALAGYKSVLHERLEGYAPSAIMSHQAGAFEVDQGPFHELICFSDCEGIIGAAVSAKLAKDFAEFDQRAQHFEEASGVHNFYERYKLWRQAFEMAADGGCVDFH